MLQVTLHQRATKDAGHLIHGWQGHEAQTLPTSLKHPLHIVPVQGPLIASHCSGARAQVEHSQLGETLEQGLGKLNTTTTRILEDWTHEMYFFH